MKSGKIAIVEVGKSMLRTAWYTVKIFQCKECHRKFPAFNFPVLNMWSNPADPNDSATYCRKCYNKIIDSPDYYLGFNPIRDFIRHLKWNWNNEVERTLWRIKYRKIEGAD